MTTLWLLGAVVLGIAAAVVCVALWCAMELAREIDEDIHE